MSYKPGVNGLVILSGTEKVPQRTCVTFGWTFGCHLQAIHLKTCVLLGNALDMFRELFGALNAMLRFYDTRSNYIHPHPATPGDVLPRVGCVYEGEV